MKKTDELLRNIGHDLGLNEPTYKGRNLPVRNCWHFYTNGNNIDHMFCDEQDFKDGMNRIFVTINKFKAIILAFTLMDTHIHFILYGQFDECNRFIHHFINITSRAISERFNESHKLANVQISHQMIHNEQYLKTAICYVLRNAPVGGIPYNALDYPWSSAPLYFKGSTKCNWTSPLWQDPSYFTELQHLTFTQKRKFLKTRNPETLQNAKICHDIVFPGEYVAYEVVEKIFKTHKSFNYFLNTCKESYIESRQSNISNLSIPMQELRMLRNVACKELLGEEFSRNLSTHQRLKLARTLKRKYLCSTKQIARICGLLYDEAKHLL